MARDYKKEERLRSAQEAIRIEKEGAYVCIPVETLEKVKDIITDMFEWGIRDETIREWLGELKDELFPEEGETI